VTATALNLASKGLLASVAVHVRLKGRRASEALVADLALVLLLRARRHLGAELTHHGLGSWGDLRCYEAVWPREGSGGDRLNV